MAKMAAGEVDLNYMCGFVNCRGCPECKGKEMFCADVRPHYTSDSALGIFGNAWEMAMVLGISFAGMSLFL